MQQARMQLAVVPPVIRREQVRCLLIQQVMPPVVLVSVLTVMQPLCLASVAYADGSCSEHGY